MTKIHSLSLALVCEGPSDARWTDVLLRRLFHEINDHGEDEELQIDWFQFEQEVFLKWSSVSALALRLGIRLHPRIKNGFESPEAATLIKAVRTVAKLDSTDSIKALLVLRDTDGTIDRKTEFENARARLKETGHVHKLACGTPHIMHENWVLLGYEPRDKEERKIFAEIKREVGDPRVNSHKLDARTEGAKRSPKRVLAALTRGDQSRADECLSSTALPLQRLIDRGKSVYFDVYVKELRQMFKELAVHTQDDLS